MYIFYPTSASKDSRCCRVTTYGARTGETAPLLTAGPEAEVWVGPSDFGLALGLGLALALALALPSPLQHLDPSVEYG